MIKIFSRLWNYLKGYVIIEISGFSTERFLNLALFKGICFYRLCQSPRGVFLQVKVKDFKKLKSCAKKSGCKIRIKKRCGVPFFINKNKKRYPFLIGALAFIFIVYFLSSFIWQIDIVGNTKINDAELLTFFKENGLKVGTYKADINSKELIRLLKNKYPDISWATLKTKGTKITLKLAEGIQKPEDKTNPNPCNIVAKNDGIILSMITSKGTPQVKVNDVVKKGDILVSSLIEIKNDEAPLKAYYVHSFADIKAKQWYNINITIPLEYKVKEYTGGSKSEYGIKILENKFQPNFIKKGIYFKNYDTINNEKQLNAGENYPLPIAVLKTDYKEYKIITKKRSLEEAKALAQKKLNAEIINSFSSESEILDKSLSFSQDKDNLRLNAKVIITDNIGEEQYINNTAIEGSNSINGTGKNTNSE